LIAREQDRADIKRHRRRWRTHQKRVAPSRLVFIDETWTKTNMTRLHGWAPKGERLLAKVPHGRWKTATFLAALRNDRIVSAVLTAPSSTTCELADSDL
jgi:putative transposase